MKLLSRQKVSSSKQPVSVRFGVRTFRLNPEPKFPDFRYRVAVPEISGHWIASNARVRTQIFFGTPKPEMWYFHNSQIQFKSNDLI